MTSSLRKTGLEVLGDLPWGTHCCHFYDTSKDLLDTLLPYFRIGLENREFCLWVIHEPLTVDKVRRALRDGIPHGDRYLTDGSIEIVPSRQWYLKRGALALTAALRGWHERLAHAVARGYAGIRVNGDTGWLKGPQWKRFSDYEQALNDSLARKPMIVLCSYPIRTSGAAEVLDVARTHQFAIAKREGKWEVVEWKAPPTSQDLYASLTAREREVLLLAAEGRTNPQVADRLSIGVRTVESHRASLMRKLGVRNQTALVRYAIQRGLLAQEHPRS
jgi:DNA-binding CsgD family transcriptional regulator